jgi:hypothetical protein
MVKKQSLSDPAAQICSPYNGLLVNPLSARKDIDAALQNRERGMTDELPHDEEYGDLHETGAFGTSSQHYQLAGALYGPGGLYGPNGLYGDLYSDGPE